jgi:hypothetical protein
MYLLLTIMKNSYLNLAFVFGSVAVANTVPVNPLSPDCFLCIIFLLKTVISDLYCFYEKKGQIKFLANNEKHIVIFMSYDSMNDIK